MVETLGLKALHKLDPEQAHHLSIRALQTGLVPMSGLITSPRLKTTVGGLDLPNPVGLAAGYDKNAQVVDQLCKAGFGFVEVGAATPRPQPGNPKPRLFRLTEDRAVINRFGFNNEGADAIAARLRARTLGAVPVGLNLGANKDSIDRAGDFAHVLRVCGPFIDFATVNVSSPNTEKLRDLQGAAALSALLAGVMEARSGLSRRIPVFLKIAPDLNSEEIAEIGEVALASGLDAVITTNTTLAREGLASAHKGETGGMSGAPLFEKSTRVLAQLSKATEGKIPLIGVGGISTPEQAIAKLQAGASAVQVYSALVYEGLSLIPRIVRGIESHLQATGLANVSALTGSGRDQWL
ncbi:quinone-dependent dihydroorotate dehydrogenase [Falsigemmobacter faecalis]|uniref:Dihydroorotate dehydrogenase (quinone) n=1 Tax=Falsigemmobacter faecalis TaxID=2488730 RepID=A0A3P3DVC6_9RHOB|nr:quinone-dependent dihydroorotate dehydrogenase [Falsigemmobacter faecalis]RRH77402.1 quinone-dependent dihydroorotate dehydrogenase [Falsigemmobacter faecalis]